jgi:predicted short-subunit dehydrogenase-like oxidoreductase (DUF2520 family)
MLSVVLIGGGNVAFHLMKAFQDNPHVDLKQWYNRTIDPLTDYASRIRITDDLSTLMPADIYLIAVSDDAIRDVSQALPFSNRLVAHTSGSASIHDLDSKQQRAVFYPLQSFSKQADLDFSEVPICIEVLDKPNFNILKDLSDSLGCKSYKINTEQRQTLHLSAVFANNFVNQLYRIAHEISDAKSINFDILKPLILETAKKVQHMSPYRAQTGPAKRNDKKTIKRHLKLLNREEHRKIYTILTDSIKQTHGITKSRQKQT